MTTQQFFKGLMMALVAVIVTAFSTVPIDWVMMGVAAVSTILIYSGKNLIAVLHSDSPVGSLSWINLISGVLIAIGTALIDSVAIFLIEGSINWLFLGKLVLSVALTYFGGTFFAPPYTVAKVKGFVK